MIRTAPIRPVTESGTSQCAEISMITPNAMIAQNAPFSR
jgi:hypothetical protein